MTKAMNGTVEVMHGDDCVALLVEHESGVRAGVVLTPAEAETIAARLVQQASYARTPEGKS